MRRSRRRKSESRWQTVSSFPAPLPAPAGSGFGSSRTRARTSADSAEKIPAARRRALPRCTRLRSSANTSPALARSFSTTCTTPASRTTPLPPAARTNISPRRPKRTSAETRCRCTVSKQTPARQSAARRPESPALSLCPWPGCD